MYFSLIFVSFVNFVLANENWLFPLKLPCYFFRVLRERFKLHLRPKTWKIQIGSFHFPILYFVVQYQPRECAFSTCSNFYPKVQFPTIIAFVRKQTMNWTIIFWKLHVFRIFKYCRIRSTKKKMFNEFHISLCRDYLYFMSYQPTKFHFF